MTHLERPQIDPSKRVDEQIVSILQKTYPSLTMEFMTMIADMYDFFFLIGHDEFYDPRFAGFGSNACAQATKILGFLTGNLTNPPFEVSFNGEFISIRYKDRDRAQSAS